MSVVMHPFTLRLLKRTDRFASFPSPLADPLVLAVKDELLVAEDAADAVTSFLVGRKLSPKIPVKSLPRIFGDGSAEDVVIVPIQGTDPFKATALVRKQPFLAGKADSVSPNHILVPAPNEDFCPWGPPSPTYGYPAAAPEAGSAGEPVTVIDASYLWNDAQWGASNNPLTELCDFQVRWAEWHKHGDGWQSGTPTALSRNGTPGVLDALVGHANFVAGVVARECHQPKITIWSHNGGFPKGSDEYPTEASVCRSIWASQRPASAGELPLSPKPVVGAPARVIHVGFAFHPYGNVPSKIWRLTFGRIVGLKNPGGPPIIVAPAGNQTSTLRRYPAAFMNTFNPVRVVGVASIQPGGNARSSFTNYGSWVTCAAVGEDVESTFVHVKMKLEEDTSNPRLAHDFTGSNWATWNGTSFASPKITGHLAARLSIGASSAQVAWNALKTIALTNAGSTYGSQLDVGDYVFDF
jgi:Subtilase family